MLLGTTWENSDLGTPRSSDREQNSPVVGEERRVPMGRLPRRGRVPGEPTERSLSHGAHPPGRQPGQNDETRPNEMGDSAPRLDLGSGRFGRAKQPEKNFDVANRLPPLSRRLRERSRDHGLEKRRGELPPMLLVVRPSSRHPLA